MTTLTASLRDYASNPDGWTLLLQVPEDALRLAPQAARVHLHHVAPSLPCGSMGTVTSARAVGQLLEVTVPEGPFSGLLYTFWRYSRELQSAWSTRPSPDNEFRLVLELL